MDNVLVGKTITAIFIASDKGAIKFVTDAGDIVARADGDCCSHSWIEHVELAALGLPAKVVSADDTEMPDLGSPSEDDCIAYYGFKIVTDKGEIVIDYRNSSNGYYGGNLVWPGDGYFYGGVHGQNVSNEDWQEVTADL